MASLLSNSSLFLYSASCTSNHGRLKRSADANQLFRSYHLSPDHNYYYSGSAGKPNAILGLEKKYTLISKLWKPIEPDAQQLKKLIDNTINPSSAHLHNYGAAVLGPSGEQIGIWYSKWDKTVVERKSETEVVVHPPKRRMDFYD